MSKRWFVVGLLVSSGSGIAVGLAFGLGCEASPKGLDAIATVSGTVFALLAGAGTPILYTAGPERILYWSNRRYRDRAAESRTEGPKDLRRLKRSIVVLSLASLALLGALLVALFALYGAKSDDATPQRLLGPVSIGLMTAGLLMATLFLLTLLRFDQINKMIDTLTKDLPEPPPEPTVGNPKRSSTS